MNFRKYRFMMLRRFSQLSILLLFAAGNFFGWHLLRGNLSTSRLFDKVLLADPFALIQVFAAAQWVSSEALIGALIITSFFGIIGGRSFCSWICPVNPVTDLANFLRRKLKLDVEGKTILLNRKARYWIIGLSIILSVITGVAAFEWISPVSMLHRGIIYGMGMGWLFVFGVFLFDLFVTKNGFCGHLCPLGGFYSLISSFSLVRVRHYKERCSLCMKCLEICPERQVLPMVGKISSIVTSGECTNCARCIEVCDDRAMRFGLRI